MVGKISLFFFFLETNLFCDRHHRKMFNSDGTINCHLIRLTVIKLLKEIYLTAIHCLERCFFESVKYAFSVTLLMCKNWQMRTMGALFLFFFCVNLFSAAMQSWVKLKKKKTKKRGNPFLLTHAGGITSTVHNVLASNNDCVDFNSCWHWRLM